MKKIFSYFFISILFINQLFANTNYMYKDLDYLNLSETQTEQVREILLSQRKEFSKYYKKKNYLVKKLENIVKDEYFDEDEYEDILEELYEEAVEVEAKILEKLHKILTSEQREKLSQRLKEWRVE